MVPIMHHMTTASMTVPEWSLAGRLIRRNRPYLLAVALTCGVDPDWLISGTTTESDQTQVTKGYLALGAA